MTVRVGVVDDSALGRACLRELLEADGDIRVVAEAGDGPSALRLLDAEPIDVLSVDWHMPGMSGLDLVERIMAQRPVPILVLTAHELGDLPERALRAGALAAEAKPEGPASRSAAEIRERVRFLATIPVVRHAARARPTPVPAQSTIRVVGIGASAGGLRAALDLLASVRVETAPCFALVQHLPNGFAATLASVIAARTPMSVRIADRPVPIEPGVVIVPADDRHLVLSATHALPSDAPPHEGHRPSVDLMLASLARLGPRAAGVVLSGIGRDGTAGLLELRRSGGLTFAQDERSSGVFGMPRAAFEEGAASHVLSPDAIGRVVSGDWSVLGG